MKIQLGTIAVALALFMLLIPFGCERDEKELSIVQLELKSASIGPEENSSTLFGPMRFNRVTGKPELVEVSVSGEISPCLQPPFVFHFASGDEVGNNRVSSAVIKLDGKELFVSSNFSQQVSSDEMEVSLSPSSKLEVILEGIPGSYLDIWIEGELSNTWQKCLGGSDNDRASSLIHTSDGGYAVTGYSYSTDGDVSGNHGNGDFWVVKLNASGEIDWQKCLGGSSHEYSTSIIQSLDGGYAIAGYSQSNDGDVSGNHGGADSWIVKLDASGDITWQRCLGGSGWDTAGAIIQTFDGGYAVAGTSGSNDGDVSGNHGSNDIWIVKLDANGGIDWQKCLGGTGTDRAGVIIQTFDGGYAVAGISRSNDGDVSGNHGGTDSWLVKLDASGNIQGQRCLGGSSFEYVYSAIQTSDGGYAVASTSHSNDGDVSETCGGACWVVKLNANMGIVWQKCLGTSVSSEEGYLSIIQTSDDGYAVAGSSRDVLGNHSLTDTWIVKLNASGGIDWEKFFGGSGFDVANSIIQTSDGGYVMAAHSTSNDGDVSGNHGENDYWMLKLDQDGNLCTP
jgi:hypothetical protein